MTLKKGEINEADELDIKCLLNDIDICQVRLRLRVHFGSEVKMECPLRKRLREKFRQWKVGKEHDELIADYLDAR